MTNRLRNLHPGALHLADPLAAQLLVAERNRIQLVGYLAQLLVQSHQLGQVPADLIAALVVGRALFLEIAQIDERVQLFGLALDLIGDFDGAQLHQRRTANSLLHPQLAALHATGQIHFALARQQRDGTHFAQIHAYRVVGINRFLDRMRMGEIFAVMHFLRVEKAAFLVERKPERLMTLA